MFNNDFKKYRNLEVIETNTAGELKAFLSQITIPCEIIAIYYADKKHIALINPIRPISRIKIIKKSPRDTDKEYKET